MCAKKSTGYDERNIKVLKGLDGVRKRPSMYIGDTGVDGFHHMVYEILDNSIDEAVNGFCDKIIVTFHNDGSVSIKDNGRGIPTGKHPTEKIPTVDVVLTMLHAGGKFGGKDSKYKTTGGLHGVGASVVNALSKWVDVIIHRDGKEFYRRYENGIPTQKALKITKNGIGKKNTGTFIRFMPDKTIFKACEFSQSTIVRRLRELSYLNEGIEIKLVWESDGSEQVFFSKNGLTEYIEYLIGKKTMLHNPIRVKDNEIGGCSVDVAFVYDDGFDNSLHTFANNINTVEGGVHYNAALDSLAKVICSIASSGGLLKNLGIEPSKSDIMEGLTLVCKVMVPEPQFGGQTKTKLNNQDLRGPLGTWMLESFEKALKRERGVAKIVAGKIVDAIKARDAARKAKNLSRKKSTIESLTLPGKLADCSSKNHELCELYVVEGDSAGGTAKMARDRTFQAVLPLRGKILNTQKTSLNKALEHEEIASLISAIGVNPRDINNDDLRYHKIIIMTDADPDGGHISCLLMTMFHKHMKRLLEDGKVYVCDLPLYSISYRGKKEYLKDDAALDEFMKKHKGQKVDISRFKGLGEMNPEQLEECAMSPLTRKLKQIHIGDEIEAANVTTCLMGSDVTGRKEFLAKNLRFEDET